MDMTLLFAILKTLRSEVTAHSFTFFVCIYIPNINMRMYITIDLIDYVVYKIYDITIVLMDMN